MGSSAAEKIEENVATHEYTVRPCARICLRLCDTYSSATKVLMSRSRLKPARSQPHASPPAETALSRNFVTSALKAAALSDLWIASDRDRAVDAVQLATVATASDSDRRALEELLALFANVQSWSDARVDEERNLRLATYYALVIQHHVIAARPMRRRIRERSMGSWSQPCAQIEGHIWRPSWRIPPESAPCRPVGPA